MALTKEVIRDRLTHIITGVDRRMDRGGLTEVALSSAINQIERLRNEIEAELNGTDSPQTP